MARFTHCKDFCAAMAIILSAVVLAESCRSAGAQAPNHYYVILASETSESEAQKKAEEAGAWVLDTNLYSGLTADLHAVVRGPFSTAFGAKTVQAFMRGAHPDAYVKNAGEAAIAEVVGNRVPRVLIVAVLGDVKVDVIEQPGGRHGCEPQEPYLEVTAKDESDQTRGGVNDAIAQPADRMGATSTSFRIIQGTGELRMSGRCELELYEGYLSKLEVRDPYSISRAEGYFKWHFTPTGSLVLGDSALAEFRTLYGRVFWKTRNAVDDPALLKRLYMQHPTPGVPHFGGGELSEELAALPDSAVAATWKTLADNGLAVGIPGYSAPAYFPGYWVVKHPEYLLEAFSDRVSTTMREFLRVEREEMREGITGHKYRFDLGHPLVAWEEFISNSGPDFALRSEAASKYKDRLEEYLVGYYRGPPLWDYEDGTSFISGLYSTFAEKYPGTETARLFSRYYDVLEANEFKCTPRVERFVAAINLADLQFGGRPLYPRGSPEAELFPDGKVEGGGWNLDCWPDESGTTLRSGTLSDGRAYEILGAETEYWPWKAWLICHPLDASGEKKTSSLLVYSMYEDEIIEWASNLRMEEIEEFTARYCG